MASTSDNDRCAEAARFKRIDAAFRDGDLEALRDALENPDGFPNGQMPLATVAERNLDAAKTLLTAGADPALRTRIDECETPGEMARAASLAGFAAVLS